MKLIKALATAAFSAALFSPVAFASTDSETFTFSHDVAFTCSINDSFVVSEVTDAGGGVLTADVTKIKVDSANGTVNLQFAPVVSKPSGSDAAFAMSWDGAEYATGTVTASAVETNKNKTLDVKFTDATETGTYSAVVTASCVFGG